MIKHFDFNGLMASRTIFSQRKLFVPFFLSTSIIGEAKKNNYNFTPNYQNVRTLLANLVNCKSTVSPLMPM